MLDYFCPLSFSFFCSNCRGGLKAIFLVATPSTFSSSRGMWLQENCLSIPYKTYLKRPGHQEQQEFLSVSAHGYFDCALLHRGFPAKLISILSANGSNPITHQGGMSVPQEHHSKPVAANPLLLTAAHTGPELSLQAGIFL